MNKTTINFFGRLFFCACIFMFNLVQGQSVANYTNTRTTGNTYSSISTTGNSLPTWRNTGSNQQDDNRSDFVSIGFDFWYNGTRYTQFSASTNGFIDFSSSTDDGGPYPDAFGYDNTAFTINSGNGTYPAIAPFYDDLTAQGGTSALGNSIKYLVTGTAPNRTLTVEWINMAVFGNTSPSLNFQVKLVENTGKILVHYGTMNSGTFTFSYSMGMNVTGQSTPATLKMLQTVNTNNFTNNQANNLSAMPAANSRYEFAPPAPTAAPASLTFSGVGSGGMTLNWSDLASNELGYVIYNSVDGTNYSFVTQTAANATSAVISGLLPSTTYYWRVYAVTEGCLSAPLNGTQATTPGQNKISINTGLWATPTTWSPTGVPASGDDVTIASNHTVSIDIDAQCNSLNVGTGGAANLRFSGNNARTLNTYSTITISSGANFNIASNSNQTHTLVVRNNMVNNGTLNFSVDGNSICHTTFSLNGNITVNGSGSNSYNTITLNMGNSASNIVDITTPTFSVPANFLTLNKGTFRLSTTGAVNITPFSVAATIPQLTGLWINSANAVVNTGAGITLVGNLTVSSGIMNIGNAQNEDILVSGGQISVSSGTLNVGGKIYSSGINNLCFYNQTGGTVIVPAFASTSTSDAPFQITGVGSSFNMSGGSIIIPREGGNGSQDFGYVNTGVSSGAVTGGTLQLGNTSTPAGQTISINSNFPVGNLLVNSANATGKLVTNSLSVLGNVTMTAGNLNANNLDITLGGNWSNSGGIFTPGTALVTFSSNAAQSLSRTGGETFNHLLFTGSGVKTFSSAITASGNFSVNTGSSVDVSTSNYQLTSAGNFVNNGTFNARNGLVFFNGATAQTIGGTSTTNFFDMTLNNSAGLTLQHGENLLNTLTLNNGAFNTGGQAFTMVSTASRTARIAQITGSGDITGNVIVQRFAPGGYTGWALLGSCITSALTLSDWDDDIFISCPSCPDGSAGGFLSIYTYDETKPGVYDAAAAYVPLTGISNPITPGKGYWVYLGTGSVTTSNITLDLTGQVRKFNYTIPLNYTNYGSALNDGWNLISNPYPSPVRWSLLRGATANIDNAVYAYNADLNAGAGGYATYINNISSPAIGAGGISDTIPIGQAFYVHSTGATGLNAQESNKVGGNPTFLKLSSSAAAASATPLIRLWLNGSGGKHDETVLYLQSGASDFFDDGYDAYKMRGQDPNAPIIALEKGTTEFQVNGVAPISGNFSMPLKALTGYNGTYTISANNVGSFPSGACITLYDNLTSITTDLKTSNYVCTLSNTTTAARFTLNITINPLTINSNLNQPTCIAPSSGEIIAQGNSSGPWNYYWKDASNTIVKTSLNKTTADTLTGLITGNYNVEISTVGMCDNNVSSFMVNPVDIPIAGFSCPDTVDLYTSGLINFTNSSANALTYAWDFGDGSGSSTATSPTYVYGTTGVYIVSLISTSGTGCNDTVSKTVVVVNNIPLGISSVSFGSNLIVKTLEENNFRIQEQLTESKECHFKLYDAVGKLIVDYGSSKGKTIDLPVNLKNYPSGIYFLNLTIDSEKRVIKLPVK